MIQSNPQNGTLGAIIPWTLLSANVTFTPNDDFFGENIFNYTASDGTDESDIGLVTVDVVSVNDEPVIIILGNNPESVELNLEIYVDAGATAALPPGRSRLQEARVPRRLRATAELPGCAPRLRRASEPTADGWRCSPRGSPRARAPLGRS